MRGGRAGGLKCASHTQQIDGFRAVNFHDIIAGVEAMYVSRLHFDFLCNT